MIPNIDFDTYERDLLRRDESYWIERGRHRAFSLFKRASELVPAYRDFLKKTRLQPHRIKSVKDFSHVPPTSKENYIQIYPLEKRCWDGILPQSGIIAASSGTSGAPNFWLRGRKQEEEAALLHEFIYRQLCGAGVSPSLVIMGFPLGVYVSGVATLLPTWAVADRCKLTIVSAGANEADIMLTLRAYAPSYKTIIITGHPFFIKDVIETSIAEKTLPRISHIALLLCSEGFSEAWRLYLKNLLTPYAADIRIMSMYGSSEFLIMAHETNDSIAIKQKLEKTATAYSVFQYHPILRYFEVSSGEFLSTAGGHTPLIRHSVHDAGTLLSKEESSRMLDGREPQWRLPFLLLKGRSDQTLVFYAANIYPEHVRQALDHPPFHRKITGKFSLEKRQLPSMDQRFLVIVECRMRVKLTPALQNALEKRLFSYLTVVNNEYLFISQHLDHDVRPHVMLRPYQDPEYFRPGVKPRYIHNPSE